MAAKNLGDVLEWETTQCVHCTKPASFWIGHVHLGLRSPSKVRSDKLALAGWCSKEHERAHHRAPVRACGPGCRGPVASSTEVQSLLTVCDGSGWIDANVRKGIPPTPTSAKRCPGCSECLLSTLMGQQTKKAGVEVLRGRKEGRTLRELGDAWRSGVQEAVAKLREFKRDTTPGSWSIIELAAQDLESRLLPKDMHFATTFAAKSSKEGPRCKHSACRQHWIESGDRQCLTPPP